MNTLDIDLKNCYGIKKLQHHFDFSKGNTHIIYAPNGAMKSSLALVFKDIADESFPRDRIFPQRKTECKILVDGKDEIDPESIFVIESYNEIYNSEKMSTLLVNEKLRAKFENIHKKIDVKKKEFIYELTQKSGFRKDIESEFTETFLQKDFFETTEIINEILKNEIKYDFSYVKYNEIFNEKVLSLIQEEDFLNNINSYVEKYNELIDKSPYFKKDVFNHTNANEIHKNLKKNMFFKADHSISLKGDSENKIITSDKELIEFIENEKKKIFSDPDLHKKFTTIDTEITKHQNLRTFRKLIENKPEIIPELIDIDEFKKKIWISYIKQNKDIFNDLIQLFLKAKKEIKEIVDEAKQEIPEWKNVVDIFNNRFSVPYKITIQNQDDVILKDAVPLLVFTYEDGLDKAEIGRDELMSVLSNGERRALYLLNIIFEIEARKRIKQETLLIIDDIADSFDYKNKYAIVEYLKDISEDKLFQMIIMTHNFDFNRTVHSRLYVSRENCFMTTKDETEVNLTKAEYLKNAFVHWKQNMHLRNNMFIASISFVRNIIEYTDSKSSVDYQQLTSLVHIKPDTYDITNRDLELIFNRYLRINLNLSNKDEKVIDQIFELADNCSSTNEVNISLENKVVLSIAIRLKAEEYMIHKINNPSAVSSITKNQTIELLKKFKQSVSSNKSITDLLMKVNLITPENIHLNSFMYEPILDMSGESLKNLYLKIKEIN